MPIKVGDRIPSSRLRVSTPEGPAWKTTEELFKGKKVALFAVPGAFTPTCSNQHLPSVVQNADALRAKGVDVVALTAVNDPMVMG
ncbi:MAG TPA: redoxin family protein, partial [Xanthobacteraceae bacterium]|nr:redoxin family protein [Xanthobacteraceae bacterium]